MAIGEPGLDALAGIRVVDLSWAMAGPVSAEVLGFMGAEVIKIESSKRPCITRIAPHPVTRQAFDFDPQPYFITKNFNKLGVRIDLTHPAGIELVKRIVKISDVVVTSFRPGVIEKMGLGYEVLKEIKPDIIMLSTSTNGTEGPEAHYAGYAPLFNAAAGLGDLTGYVDGPPTEMRLTIDGISAMFNAYSILAALVHRQQSGEGQYIDEASQEAVACVIGDSIMDYTMNGNVQTRNGNMDETMAPHNCYPCSGEDRWISIAVATEQEWQSLCHAMGDPEWTKNEDFADARSRWENQGKLDELLSAWTVHYTDYQLMEMLQNVGVAAVPSFSSDELFSDPHLAERDFTQIVEQPGVGAWLATTPPWKLSATPARIKTPAPSLGQHNDYVLRELLKLSPDEIARLDREGVFT